MMSRKSITLYGDYKEINGKLYAKCHCQHCNACIIECKVEKGIPIPTVDGCMYSLPGLGFRIWDQDKRMYVTDDKVLTLTPEEMERLLPKGLRKTLDGDVKIPVLAPRIPTIRSVRPSTAQEMPIMPAASEAQTKAWRGKTDSCGWRPKGRVI